MTSEGPYPPGYEPADGLPYGRGSDDQSEWQPRPAAGQVPEQSRGSGPGSESPLTDRTSVFGAPPGSSAGPAGSWPGAFQPAGSPPEGAPGWQHGADRLSQPTMPGGIYGQPGQVRTPDQSPSRPAAGPGVYGSSRAAQSGPYPTGDPYDQPTVRAPSAPQDGRSPAPYIPPESATRIPSTPTTYGSATPGLYGSPARSGEAPASGGSPWGDGTGHPGGGRDSYAGSDRSTGYGTPVPGARDGYGTPGTGARDGFGGQPGHGGPGSYGGSATYGDQGSYGGPATYGGPASYGGSANYGRSETYGGSAGFGGPTGSDGPGGFASYGGQRVELGQRGEAPPIEAEGRKSRRGLVIGLTVAVVLVVVLGAVAIVLSMSKGDSYAVGSCVKKSGDKAVSATCTDADAYKITSKVDSSTKCPDQSQPYVVIKHPGSTDDVLCLKPMH